MQLIYKICWNVFLERFTINYCFCNFQAIQQVQALNGLQATGSTINQVTPTLSVSAPSIITSIASPHPNSAVSPSPVTAFQGSTLLYSNWHDIAKINIKF